MAFEIARARLNVFPPNLDTLSRKIRKIAERTQTVRGNLEHPDPLLIDAVELAFLERRAKKLQRAQTIVEKNVVKPRKENLGTGAVLEVLKNF